MSVSVHKQLLHTFLHVIGNAFINPCRLLHVHVILSEVLVYRKKEKLHAKVPEVFHWRSLLTVFVCSLCDTGLVQTQSLNLLQNNNCYYGGTINGTTQILQQQHTVKKSPRLHNV